MSKSNTCSFIFTNDRSISIWFNGVSYSVGKSHASYNNIVKALKEKNCDLIPELFDISTALKKEINNKIGEDAVSINDGVIYYKGNPLHNTLTARILSMMNEGLPYDPFVNFLSNLMKNPSFRAVNCLYDFLEKNIITITEDGYFLAYKRVKDDYTDFYTGLMDNSVGKIVKMDRNMCNEDPDVHCAEGLHVCGISYLRHYHDGMGKAIICKVNPKDVVAVPKDYNGAKMRCCEYLVLEDFPEYTSRDPKEKYTQAAVRSDGKSFDEGDHSNPEINNDICDQCGKDYEDCECDYVPYSKEGSASIAPEDTFGVKPNGDKYWNFRDKNGKFIKKNK